MTASALRSSLSARGVGLALVAGRVRVTAPEGALADADRVALAEHRDALLALLDAETRGEGGVSIPPVAPANLQPSGPCLETLTGEAAAKAVVRSLAPRGRGGIVIAARALDGREILLIHDEHVIVPEKYRDLPRFTLAELEQIGRERWSAARLRAVVLVKEALRTAEHPEEQARLVPADEATEMRRTMIPAREWLAWPADARPAPSRVMPTLEEHCAERQGWLVSFPSRGPQDP